MSHEGFDVDLAECVLLSRGESIRLLGLLLLLLVVLLLLEELLLLMGILLELLLTKGLRVELLSVQASALLLTSVPGGDELRRWLLTRRGEILTKGDDLLWSERGGVHDHVRLSRSGIERRGERERLRGRKQRNKLCVSSSSHSLSSSRSSET